MKTKLRAKSLSIIIAFSFLLGIIIFLVSSRLNEAAENHLRESQIRALEIYKNNYLYDSSFEKNLASLVEALSNSKVWIDAQPNFNDANQIHSSLSLTEDDDTQNQKFIHLSQTQSLPGFFIPQIIAFLVGLASVLIFNFNKSLFFLIIGLLSLAFIFIEIQNFSDEIEINEILEKQTSKAVLSISHTIGDLQLDIQKINKIIPTFIKSQESFDSLGQLFVDTKKIQGIEYVKATSSPTQIWKKLENGEIKPVEKSEGPFFPVVYASPFELNKLAINYDLGSEEIRKHALDLAMKNGQTIVSDKIHLVQKNSNASGFLIFSPLETLDPSSPSFLVVVIETNSLFRDLESNHLQAKITIKDINTENKQIELINSLKDINAFTFTHSISLYNKIITINAQVNSETFKMPYKSPIGLLIISYIIIISAIIIIMLMTRNNQLNLEKQLEEKTATLTKSESYFRSLFNGASTAFIVLDQDIIIDANNFATRLFQTENLIKQSILSFLDKLQPDQTHSQEILRYHSFLAQSKSMSSTTIYFNIAGEKKCVETNFGKFEDKTLLGLHDINDAKNLERALLLANDRFSLASEAAEMGVWEWEISKNKFSHDDRFRTLLKTSRQIENLEDFVEFVDKDYQKPLKQIIRNSIQSKKTIQYEFKITFKDQTLYFRFYAKIRKNNLNLPTHLVGVLHEITSQKNIEFQLRSALEKANSATKAKSEFLANVSHEIRTPLNGIIGVSDILLRSTMTDEQKSLFQTVHNSGLVLLELINDILDLSKIEAGKLNLEEIEFDLLELLHEILKIMAIKASEKEIELLVDILPYSARKICGDKLRIRQIITNLLSNAIKFTHKGSVTLKYRALELEAKYTRLEFSVIDTGIGIQADKMKLIFEKFSQADSSTTRKYGGTGLGLSITQELCKKMGGNVKVESIIGQGSIFTAEIKTQILEWTSFHEQSAQLRYSFIAFSKDFEKSLSNFVHTLGLHASYFSDETLYQVDPEFEDIVYLNSSLGKEKINLICDDLQKLRTLKQLRIITSQTDAFSSLEQKKLHIEKILPRPAQPFEIFSLNEANNQTNSAPLPLENLMEKDYRVLLVEDNLTNQIVAKAQLQRLKAKILLAQNGLEALELFKENSFSMVFMDIQMPIMDGLEATRKIRLFEKENSLTPTPIIAMTAHAMASDRDECFKAGMNDYITKPIQYEILNQTVQNILSREVKSIALPLPPTEKQDFDQKGFLARILFEKPFAIELIGQYENQLKTLLIEIQEAMDRTDYSAIRIVAHKLKGASLTMGGIQLGNTAHEIEKASDLHNEWDVKSLLHRFEMEAQTLIKKLHNTLEDWQSGSN